MGNGSDNVYSRGFNVPIVVERLKSLTHNNVAELSGQVISGVALNHECYNRRFFRFIVKTLDFNSYELPVLVSEQLIKAAEQTSGLKLQRGSWVILTQGAWRSYNEPVGNRTRLAQCYFGKKMQIVSEDEVVHKNRVYLDGYVCRGGHPTDPRAIFIRTTPQTTRKIVDILIAVNRPRGAVNESGFTPTKTDYLPLLFWDKWAEEAVKLRVGDRIQVEAIMQSRKYDKLVGYDDTNQPIVEQRIAYELTATKFRVVDEVLK